MAADGTVLRGWFLPPIQMTPADERDGGHGNYGDFSPKPVPLVLVFAGQGGEASRYFDLAERLPDMAWAFINYRGYGASDGSPSDAALFDDAATITASTKTKTRGERYNSSCAHFLRKMLIRNHVEPHVVDSVTFT